MFIITDVVDSCFLCCVLFWFRIRKIKTVNQATLKDGNINNKFRSLDYMLDMNRSLSDNLIESIDFFWFSENWILNWKVSVYAQRYHKTTASNTIFSVSRSFKTWAIKSLENIVSLLTRSSFPFAIFPPLFCHLFTQAPDRWLSVFSYLFCPQYALSGLTFQSPP